MLEHWTDADSGSNGAGLDVDGSVTASFLGGDDERGSQSSSSPQSLEWASFGRARTTSSAQDSCESTTDASSLGSDDDQLPTPALQTTFSTSSLKDALDAIAASEPSAAREPEDPSPASPSHRPHLRPTHSEPPSLATLSERTPTAGFFHFPLSTASAEADTGEQSRPEEALRIP